MKYRLGLDIGTNSIGWAVIEIEGTDLNAKKILATGSRIFTDGREVKSKSTLKAARTAARSARRRADRYKQRREYLLARLRKIGLFPTDESDAKKLQNLDPLELRANAVNQPITEHELGRVLFHLNQRRGFKSNRKDPESRSGVVKDSIDKLQAQLVDSGLKTFGEFLWQYRKNKQPTRARRHGNKGTDLYTYYPSREFLEHEFETIWQYQRAHYPKLLNDENKRLIHRIIFTQRPLKPAKVGKCAYLGDEDRAYKALPTLQKYRVLQEVNNLEWSTVRGSHKLIEIPQARDLVLELFLRPPTKDGKIRFTAIQKIIKELGITDGAFKFNLQSDARKFLEGDKTAAIMQRDDYIGTKWHEMSTDEQDNCIQVILNPNLDDDEVIDTLTEQYNLSDEQANNVANANLADGAGGLSLAAATLLNELMNDQYLIQSDAVQQAVKQHPLFHNPYKLASDHDLLNELPYYGKAVRGHIIPGKGDESDEQSRIGMVSNPTVHIAMNQIRHIVNELIERFGHPSSVAIELARDLPLGEKGRTDLNKTIAQNTKRNIEAKEELVEHGQAINHDNLLRLKLWKELAENPTDRRCVFTGEMIGIEELFSSKVEIEHLIPFSISLDDSFMNKTVCKRQANRDKGQRTPYQAFGDSSNGYNWSDIFTRSQRLHENKHWRFQEDALQIWQRDHADFLARHLNDTRYIGRLTREYLANICRPNKIDVVTGRLTSLLRHHWGLNSVLDDNDKKNRDDHRHHAIDAIVVAMTNRSMLQTIARAAAKSEEMALEHLFPDSSKITPWSAFRDDVKQVMQQVVVSHKADRHKSGKLHNDTAYGIVSGPDKKGRYEVVTRKKAESVTTKKHIESVRDDYIRSKLLSVPLELVPDTLEVMGIRSLRCTETLSVIPIKDDTGRAYKAYKGDSNWAMEIYELPDAKKKWVDVIVSTYEANQNNPALANKRKPHPAAKLIMRLHRNDYLILEDENKQNYIVKIQKLSKGKVICCLPEAANTDKRNRDADDDFKYISKAAGSLKKQNAKKVHVSPTGLVST